MSTDNKIPVFHYGQEKAGPQISPQWWLEKSDTAAQSIFTVVNSIRNDQKTRRTSWINYARLYANQDIEATLSGLPAVTIDRRLSFNVCKGVTKAACAKIAKAKPRAMFLTVGGVYGMKRKAQKLTQYVDGIFTDTKIYKHGKKVFRDGCVFGTGLLKVIKKDGKIACQRTFPDEVVVDNIDGREGEPTQIHHIMALPKEAVIANFQITEKDRVKWDAINSAKTALDVYKVQNTKISDRIVVIESWKLPTNAETDDGSHKIVVSNCVIFEEKWKHNFFPFAKFDWDESLLGYWGESLVSEVVGIQLEINNVLQRIKEALELVAIPRIFVKQGSGVNQAKITDEIGAIIPYNDEKPSFLTPEGMRPEAYNYLEYLYKKAFEETGISQLSAQSKKPAGLESGVALREFQDIETERFSLVGDAYQQFYLDAAQIILAFQKELAEEAKEKGKPSPIVKTKGNGFLETIKWSEVDMDEDKFVMQAFPTNFLPRTPEGQLQFTQELVQSGYIDEKEALSLLNFPDLQRFFNLRVAALDDIERIIENILDSGKYEAPEPYMDLALTLKIAQSAYLKAKNDEVPENKLELLRIFLEDTQDLISAMSAPPPGAMPPNAPNGPAILPSMPGIGPTPSMPVMPQQGAPGAIAQPMAPPKSDLIPQTGA